MITEQSALVTVEAAPDGVVLRVVAGGREQTLWLARPEALTLADHICEIAERQFRAAHPRVAACA